MHHYLPLAAVIAIACYGLLTAAPSSAFAPTLRSSRISGRLRELSLSAEKNNEEDRTPAQKSRSRLGGRKTKALLKKTKNEDGGKKANLIVMICFAIPLLLGILSWQSIFGGADIYYYESSTFSKTVISADSRRIETTRQRSERTNMVGRSSSGSPGLLDENPDVQIEIDERLLYDGGRWMFLNDLDSFF